MRGDPARPVPVWYTLSVATGACRTLTCPDGRFGLTHANNWQHAAVYPPFLLAGILDWAALGLSLPPGLQQVKMLLPKSGQFIHQIAFCPARFNINVDLQLKIVRVRPGIHCHSARALAYCVNDLYRT